MAGFVTCEKSGAVNSEPRLAKLSSTGSCTRCDGSMASPGASAANSALRPMPAATATSGPWIQRVARNFFTAG